MKFLIDECLSPRLAVFAREKGYAQSTHVVWRGMAGEKDWKLKLFILDGAWTFGWPESCQRRTGADPAKRITEAGGYNS